MKTPYYLLIYLNTEAGTDDLAEYFKLCYSTNIKIFLPIQLGVCGARGGRTGNGASRSKLTSGCSGFTYLTSITQAWPDLLSDDVWRGPASHSPAPVSFVLDLILPNPRTLLFG